LASGGGDVRAARACAKALLNEVDAPAPVLSGALLMLTATLVHLHAQTGPDPSLQDIAETLAQLGPGLPGQALFAASPMQFLQYVAAELADGAATGAVDLAIRAIRSGAL
jgi:hypothetical protein